MEQYKGKSVDFYIRYKGQEPIIYADSGLQKSVLVYEDIFSRNKSEMKTLARQIENGTIHDLNTLYGQCKGVIILREAREWNKYCN